MSVSYRDLLEQVNEARNRKSGTKKKVKKSSSKTARKNKGKRVSASMAKKLAKRRKQSNSGMKPAESSKTAMSEFTIDGEQVTSEWYEKAKKWVIENWDEDDLTNAMVENEAVDWDTGEISDEKMYLRTYDSYVEGICSDFEDKFGGEDTGEAGDWVIHFQSNYY